MRHQRIISKYKLITYLLIVAMILSSFSWMAFAEDETGGETGTMTEVSETGNDGQGTPTEEPGEVTGQETPAEPGTPTEPETTAEPETPQEPAAPAAPVITSLATPKITVSSYYNNKARVKWNKVPNANGYEVYRDNKKIKTLNKTTFTNTGLKTNSKYSYKVRAYYKKDGKTIYSKFSNVVTVKAKHRNPRLLMVDNRKANQRIVKQFAKVGVKVTTVYDIKKVDVSKYDGLIIPGGNNMDPRSYHAKRDKHTYGTDYKKDKLQIAAIKKFAAAKKPILGICRGNQVINVAFGGTLTQHIPGWHKGNRKIRTVKDSWVRSVYGTRKTTYHSHHQCVKKLGKGLIATAYDTKDGRIEAIQHESLPIYGVQWHPDLHVNSQSYKFYRAFKNICLKNMAKA